MKLLDFRSDTVTRPSAGMLEAMFSAKLGDDVFGDDPSVNELESYAAAMFGKENAIFCSSGTMTNQIAIKVHTKPGDEVICDKLSHIYHYEGGGIAFNSGSSVRLIDGDRGRFTAEDVQRNINPDDIHHPITALVSLENTCNKGGGAIWDANAIESIKNLCNENNLPLHLDGARVFNAMAETGQSAEDVGRQFDTISICLSKGLGCPVGSLLIGDTGFIKKSRRVRKVFGGGMRQAGLLAAAGTYALKQNIDRLKLDHENAQCISNILLNQRWIESVVEVSTNIVVGNLKKVDDQSQIIEKLKELGVLCIGFGEGRIRFVTHLDISTEDINRCEDILKKI